MLIHAAPHTRQKKLYNGFNRSVLTGVLFLCFCIQLTLYKYILFTEISDFNLILFEISAGDFQADRDYAIYVDKITPAGVELYFASSGFQNTPQTTTWNTVTLDVIIPPGMQYQGMRVFLIFRKATSGTAYFDNIRMWVSSENSVVC